MVGTQASIRFAAGTSISDKIKTGKLNSATGDFYSILQSIIPSINACGAESIENSTVNNGFVDNTSTNGTAADDMVANDTIMGFVMSGNTAEDSANVKNLISDDMAVDNTVVDDVKTSNILVNDLKVSSELADDAAVNISNVDKTVSDDKANENEATDNTNLNSDDEKSCFSLLTSDISVNIPSCIENETAEKTPVLKKADLSDSSDDSDETANADKPVSTVQAILSLAEYKFSSMGFKISDGTDSATLQTECEPVKTGNRIAVQSIAEYASDITNDKNGKEAQPAESKFTAPFDAVNPRLDESVDYKTLTNLIGDSHINIESSTLKKSDGNADEAPALDLVSTKKSESAEYLSVPRFETRNNGDYATFAEKEVISGQQNVRFDSGVSDQLSNSIKAGVENNEYSQFKMKLKPEGLGEVVIKLSHKSDGIEVELSAELPSTKELISKDLDTLRARLNSDTGEKQYQFTSVTVDFKTFGTNTSFSNGQYSRSGYNADYGKSDTKYQTDTPADDKTEKLSYERYGNRLIDCIA